VKKLGGIFSPNFRSAIYLFSPAFPVGASAARAAAWRCARQPSRCFVRQDVRGGALSLAVSSPKSPNYVAFIRSGFA
jgi:hypothetical protein